MSRPGIVTRGDPRASGGGPGRSRPYAATAVTMAGLLATTFAVQLTDRQAGFGVLLLPRIAAILALAGALALLVRGDVAVRAEEAPGSWASAMIPPVAGFGYILVAQRVGPVVAASGLVPLLALAGGARGARAVIATTVATVLAVVVVFLEAAGTWFPADVRLF